jgi:small subunit ribosomal protein S20
VPHHKSAKKRVRQTTVRTARNKTKISSARSTIKSLKAAVTGGEKTKAAELLIATQSHLAKLAKMGIIKANTAARRTARLAKEVSKV